MQPFLSEKIKSLVEQNIKRLKINWRGREKEYSEELKEIGRFRAE